MTSKDGWTNIYKERKHKTVFVVGLYKTKQLAEAAAKRVTEDKSLIHLATRQLIWSEDED